MKASQYKCKCGEDRAACFYSYQKSECKNCIRTRVRENRAKNIEYYREYDRKRGNRQPPSYLREHRKKHPNQTKAQRKVAYEIRKGSISSRPCENCENPETHAHHDDYLKPLDIRWLCAGCHKQWHDENGPGLNP